MSVSNVGGVVAQTTIQKEYIALFKAVEKAMQLTLNQFIPLIARKTGAMREAFRLVLTTIVFQAAILSTGYFEITPQMVKSKMDAAIFYFKYHWISSPIGLAYYKDPTQPFTFPVDPFELMQLIHSNISDLLPKELARV